MRSSGYHALAVAVVGQASWQITLRWLLLYNLLQAAAVSINVVACLQDMRFDNTFVHELPGDKQTNNSLRQVRLLVQVHQSQQLPALWCRTQLCNVAA
jgi:hypothetical protein